MTLDSVLSALSLGKSAPEAWILAWDRVQSNFSENSLPVLRSDFFNGRYGNYGLSDDIVEIISDAAAAMRLCEPLARLAWLWYQVVIIEGKGFFDWPTPAEFPLFAALVLVSAFPRMCDEHRAKGIPMEVSLGNCRDLEIWLRHEKRTAGTWGFRQLGWMLNHVSGRLYRLGRLQYVYQAYGGSAYAFRERATGGILALSAPGISYTRDGYVNGTNGIFDDDPWISAYQDMGTEVRGYPIRQEGLAAHELVTLSLEDWELVLGSGSPTLDIHVPEDGKLDTDGCLESFKQALEFFPKYFPELPAPVAFTCGSWLLDSQFIGLLPEDSNIVKFLSLFYRFPIKSGDTEHFWRIFGEMPADLTKAPRDTTLRRAVLDFRLSGGRLRSAGGFIII